MIIKYCDICGREIRSAELGQIANGALMVIARADSVCSGCAAVAAEIDWCATVRDIWKEGNKMPRNKQFRRWGEGDAPCRGCTERTIGCHGQDVNGLFKCSRYGEFVAQNEEQKRLRQKEVDAQDMLIDVKRKKTR